MTTATLRAVGGSVMVAVPKQVLSYLGVNAGATLSFRQTDEGVVIKKARPSYTLEELIAKCDPSQAMTEDMRAWDEMPSVGMETLDDEHRSARAG